LKLFPFSRKTAGKRQSFPLQALYKGAVLLYGKQHRDPGLHKKMSKVNEMLFGSVA
jgi:hypothetical protein